MLTNKVSILCLHPFLYSVSCGFALRMNVELGFKKVYVSTSSTSGLIEMFMSPYSDMVTIESGGVSRLSIASWEVNKVEENKY